MKKINKIIRKLDSNRLALIQLTLAPEEPVLSLSHPHSPISPFPPLSLLSGTLFSSPPTASLPKNYSHLLLKQPGLSLSLPSLPSPQSPLLFLFFIPSPMPLTSLSLFKNYPGNTEVMMLKYRKNLVSYKTSSTMTNSVVVYLGGGVNPLLKER